LAAQAVSRPAPAVDGPETVQPAVQQSAAKTAARRETVRTGRKTRGICILLRNNAGRRMSTGPLDYTQGESNNVEIRPVPTDFQTGGAESGAVAPKPSVHAAPSPDFAASLAMIAALPLSPDEKAQAIRRLMADQATEGTTKADGKSGRQGG
jgi:hypothetical protein